MLMEVVTVDSINGTLGDADAGEHVNMTEDNAWATTSDRSSALEVNDHETTQDRVRDFCEDAVEKRERRFKILVKILFILFLVSASAVLVTLLIIYSGDDTNDVKDTPDILLQVPLGEEHAQVPGTHESPAKDLNAPDGKYATQEGKGESTKSPPSKGEENVKSRPTTKEPDVKGDQDKQSEEPHASGPRDFGNQQDTIPTQEPNGCIDITLFPGNDKYDGVTVVPKTNVYTYYVPAKNKRFCSVKHVDVELISEVQPNIVKTLLTVETFPEFSVISFYATDASKKTKATQFIMDSMKNKQGICTNYIRLVNDVLNNVAGK